MNISRILILAARRRCFYAQPLCSRGLAINWALVPCISEVRQPLDLSSAISPTLEAALLEEVDRARQSSTINGGHEGRSAETEYWNLVESEDRSGNVSLHSAMQTAVPEPYVSGNRSPSDVNMPHTMAARRSQCRFVAGQRLESHHRLN